MRFSIWFKSFGETVRQNHLAPVVTTGVTNESRRSKCKRWQRIKNNPFPSFEENGYYLEDAQWLSQYLSDIHPPSEKTRQSVGPGECVKLVFRLAAEDADRADNEYERMWVLVQQTDEDGNYIGVLSNDPHHDAASNGDIIHFHPLHIAALG